MTKFKRLLSMSIVKGDRERCKLRDKTDNTKNLQLHTVQNDKIGLVLPNK